MDYFSQAITPTILSAVMHKAYATKLSGVISFSRFFSCLQSHCLGMSDTSRAACMLNFIPLARQARETPLKWLDRVQRASNSIALLKLKPEDIVLLISLKGLGQEFAALVQSTINDPNNTSKPAITCFYGSGLLCYAAHHTAHRRGLVRQWLLQLGAIPRFGLRRRQGCRCSVGGAPSTCSPHWQPNPRVRPPCATLLLYGRRHSKAPARHYRPD